MAFSYSEAPGSGALRQGEFLGPIWTHKTAYPPIALARGRTVAVASTIQDLAVVLSPDCDLLWDYEARFDFLDESDPAIEHPNTVSEVRVCSLQSYGQIRPRFKKNRDGWNRVTGNQDERYHHFGAADIEGSDLCLHDLFIDFKKVTSVPTASLYEGIVLGSVQRVAQVPDIYIHDLIHRFSGFLSRVALP